MTTTAQGPAGRLGRTTGSVVETTCQVGSYLALTFDDGPHPVHTPHLLSVLREHGVTAVFCLWGAHALAHPEVVRAIVAGGHRLGNHGMHHDDMSDWPAERIEADLVSTTAAIRAAVPGVPIPYFRAPFGNWGCTPEVARRLGMLPLGWRVAAEDWEPPGTPELVRRVESRLTPGAVVLLHDGGGDRSQTVEAVAALLPRLTARGWRFTGPSRRT
ncbi:polysaccharide deacetylase family protein [Actinacidiphila paucisporea]|uniref:Peptidoglycan/xylan/chitin deacetylase, PgdA/CDA1 family n=1 Tax=Actinacidiphila paucisporea TaxID=310782 RepID=A0A1M7BQE3_9ACTN|nr:polysaccharide deacetylase family protein [Actinacidiphila paucisporea]SHL57242.1 Peptidoglycan/xylan/chitin deacetylase, PgdA/CDA1 family [Actinacidiphila paucisporea]